MKWRSAEAKKCSNDLRLSGDGRQNWPNDMKFIQRWTVGWGSQVGGIFAFKARYWLSFAVDEGAFEDYCAGSI